MADIDGLSVLLELEVSDEFSAILWFLVATFEALFFDILSRCLAASSAFMAFFSAFLLAIHFVFAFASFFFFSSRSCTCIMFKHCALVKILAPVTLFDVSLVLGVVLLEYTVQDT